MKKVFKSIIFVVILITLIQIINILLIPKYEIFNPVNYEISGEKDNSIDAIFLGDSLVYSSVSPMVIWNEYGFTSFDCAEPAQLISEGYKYLDFAVKRQSPKIVVMESNILFRDPKNKTENAEIAQAFKKYAAIGTYHDNWKKYLDKGSMDKWINPDKGYKYITKIKGAKKQEYIKFSNRYRPIPKENLYYFNKIIELCKINNIKLVLVSFPSQKSWGYRKHNSTLKIAKENKLEFIDLNLLDLGIDWKKDTKDRGSHLNYLGSKKVSTYIGGYLRQTKILTDHRNDKEYNDWHKAYNIYQKNQFKIDTIATA